jgi:hypothetical protein
MQVDLSAATFWNGAFWPGDGQESSASICFPAFAQARALPRRTFRRLRGVAVSHAASAARFAARRLLANKKRSAIRYARYLLPRPSSLALEPG